MPKSLDEILEHAEELADRFENWQPTDADIKALRASEVLITAIRERARAEAAVRDAVLKGRECGMSWSLIGDLLGTSGEAARQRYGKKSS